MKNQVGGPVGSAENPVFTFGSNLAGRHGRGAAKDARLFHGAIYGRGIGIQGNSYAIPTKDEHLNVLALSEIKTHIAAFLAFARAHPELVFNVTKVGCGLAGYSPEEIGPFFADAPSNCLLPPEFSSAIDSSRRAVVDAATPDPVTPQRKNFFRSR